jgi:hypothetical protein
MDIKCPSCARPIASRTKPLCTYCGSKIPVELLFDAEKKAKVEAELAELRERRRIYIKDPQPSDYDGAIDIPGGDEQS